jgi:hypothetical protein
MAAAVRIPADPTGPGGSDALSQGRYLVSRWYTQLERGATPASWRAWLGEFATVERVVHGAARGVVDTAFYRGVEAFLERTGAPDDVRDVVAFRRGLAGWDFRLVRTHGQRLVPELPQDEGLVPARELMEGLVAASLATGDAAAADSLFRLLLPRVQFVSGDLRMLLLAAYVEAERS